MNRHSEIQAFDDAIRELASDYHGGAIENLSVEMTYASKELIDQLIKNVGAAAGRSIFTKEFQAQKAVTGSGHLHG